MFRACIAAALLAPGLAARAATVEIISTTNATLRVMTANLTSGNNQRYEAPGIRIFQGLKPDLAALQEFNYASSSNGVNTAAALREFVDAAFGTNFSFFRETGYAIPNGIVSRWTIAESGSWDDVQVPDRGFAWARIDLPGSNDLYLVSVHLHSGGGASSRFIESTNLQALIRANFPSNAWVVLAGDFNTDSRSESCLAAFKTFLSDASIPTDQSGDPDSNAGRSKPYDYVLPSFSMTNLQVPVVIGAGQFSNGLVFDSRVFTPLSAVAPVQSADSGATQMQHMAVMKDFQISYTMTNSVTLEPPVLVWQAPDRLIWTGPSNLTFRVLMSTALPDWAEAGSVNSAGTNYVFTNSLPGTSRYFQVVIP